MTEAEMTIAALRAEVERWQRVGASLLDCAAGDLAEIARLRAEVERLTERNNALSGASYGVWASGTATHTPEGLTIMPTGAFDTFAAEIDRLRAGITAAVEGRYGFQVGDDEATEWCLHGLGPTDRCWGCLLAHLRALLDPQTPGAA